MLSVMTPIAFTSERIVVEIDQYAALSVAVFTLNPDDMFSDSSSSLLLIVRSMLRARKWPMQLMRHLHEPEEANCLSVDIQMFLVNGQVKVVGGNYLRSRASLR